MLFDNSLNDKRFRIDIRMENGYEEGCTWGARFYKRRLLGASFNFFVAGFDPSFGVWNISHIMHIWKITHFMHITHIWNLGLVSGGGGVLCYSLGRRNLRRDWQ